MIFSLIDIILFIGLSQGMFLGISLRLLEQRNTSANNVLSVTIFLSVVMLAGRIVAMRFTGDWVARIAVIVDTTIFLFGPLFYTYARRLAFNETPRFRLDSNHYLLSVVHALYAITFSLLPQEYFRSYQEGVWVQIIGFIVETLGLLSLWYYTLKCIWLIHNHKKSNSKNLSYDLGIRKYLVAFTIALSITAGLWLISYISSYFLRVQFPYVNYTTLWISIPLFIYVVGYFSFRQPEIFRVPFETKSILERPRLKPKEIEVLRKKLDHIVKEERIFLRSDLTLKSLAEDLGTSPNNLSWLLNQVYQKSFYDYINALRVEEVIGKIEENIHERHTILAIAFDSGFKAKSTFNKVFKNQTGLTPTQFIKEKNVA